MIQNADLDRLSALPLFAPMDRKALSALVAGSQTRLFIKGRELDIQGEDHLMVLLAGSVALSVREADRAAVLSTARTPGALNLACVMARASCNICWRALEEVTVLVIRGTVFQEALAKDPGLAARAYRELAVVHQQLLSGAAGQRLQSAQRRVVDYLLSLTSTGRGEALVHLPHEKHLLASLLGMTPENFSRTLGRLAGQGVLVQGGDIRMDRVERLRMALDGM